MGLWLRPVEDELNDRVASYLAGHPDIPCVATGLVADDEGLVWRTGMGRMRLDEDAPPDENTFFWLASVSKTFTATAILMLRDRGQLDLDDPVTLYVPETSNIVDPYGAIGRVTLRRLLQHRAGLPFDDPPGADPRSWSLLSRSDWLDSMDSVELMIRPGTACKYSNVGYRLLGEVVRRITGESLHSWIRAQILEPLGMGSTTHEPDHEQVGRVALGYVPDPDGDLPVPAALPDTVAFEGSGGLWSTVQDASSWVALQLRAEQERSQGSGQIIDGASLLEAHRPQSVAGYGVTAGVGFAWWTRNDTGRELTFHHGGLWRGFTAHLGFCPSERLGVVVLTNGNDPAIDIDGLGSALIDLAIRSRDGSRAGSGEQAEAHILGVRDDLVGRYKDDEATELDVAASTSGVSFIFVATPTEWNAEATDDPMLFRVADGPWVGERLRFLTDVRGEVDAVLLGGWPFQRHLP